MPCSECKQSGHNIRTCPTRRDATPCLTRPRPVRIEFIGGPIPFLPKKKTCNRAEKVSSNTWLIPDAVLTSCERQAVQSGEGRKIPKKFRDLLYASTEYKKYMSSSTGKPIRRGSNAKNWRINGAFICQSLHKADNIYQTLGKRVWCDDRAKAGGGPANTWPNTVPPENRCGISPTNFSGAQCLRSITASGKSPCLCTQHFKCS